MVESEVNVTPVETLWIENSQSIAQISLALSKAQGQIPDLKKDSTAVVPTKSGASYSYSYASLGLLVSTIKKPLSDNELSIIFSANSIQGTPALTAKLMHSSGEWIKASCPLFLKGQDMQDLGSAKTYARRYIIQELLNIFADEDDDANLIKGNDFKIEAKPTTQPVAQKPPNLAPQTQAQATNKPKSTPSLSGQVRPQGANQP